MDNALNFSVLLIEDNPGINEINSIALSNAGFGVTSCADGFKALELIESRRFDVIIVDMQLPKMHGSQLVSYIRANFINRSAYIIVLSGQLTNEIVITLTNSGVFDILEKPHDVNELVSKVKAKFELAHERTIAYSPRIVEIFSRSAIEVLAGYVDRKSITVKPAFIRSDRTALGTVSALIPLFGRSVFGSVSITFEEALAKKLSRVIFGEDAALLNNEMLADIASEFVNQLAGRVVSHLGNYRFTATLGLPVSYTGIKHELPHLVSSARTCISMTSDGSACAVEVCLGRFLEGSTSTEGDLDVFLYETK